MPDHEQLDLIYPMEDFGVMQLAHLEFSGILKDDARKGSYYFFPFTDRWT